MKKLIAFVILYSFLCILWTFLILCPSIKAQWEGAQVQRLTYNNLQNKVKGLYIEEDDELLLFYQQIWFDSLNWTYRDTLFLMTKEKNGEWSQPEMIGNSSYDNLVRYYRYVDYDPTMDVIHIFYATSDTLYYTNSNMPNWETVKTDSGPDRVHPSAIEFDTLGNIHLLWNVDYCSLSVNWYRVMYANNSTGEWVKQQVSPPIFLGYMGSGPSYFAVQKNGAVHVVYHGDAYCDWECQAFYARNDSLNSTNWITDTLPKPSRPLYGYNPGPIKVDINDKVHLITGGCIAQDCVWPGLVRHFYYSKQAEDSTWQGPETLPDTTFGSLVWIDQLLIDKDGIPYLTYGFSSGTVYFTDRKQGNWKVPYFLVGWRDAPPPADSLSVDNFRFVLDSQGKGHGAFSGFDISTGWWPDDSLEIYYLSSYSSSVDTEEDHKTFHFKLFQNYPNPFNSSTMITYEIEKGEKVTLKIYDILGREVRKLVNTSQKPGRYKAIWDGKNNQGKEVSSGIYFYQLKVGNFIETKKLLLIK